MDLPVAVVDYTYSCLYNASVSIHLSAKQKYIVSAFYSFISAKTNVVSSQ